MIPQINAYPTPQVYVNADTETGDAVILSDDFGNVLADDITGTIPISDR